MKKTLCFTQYHVFYFFIKFIEVIIMAVYVNTNISSLNGRPYLNNVQNQLTTTYQRLSSGIDHVN